MRVTEFGRVAAAAAHSFRPDRQNATDSGRHVHFDWMGLTQDLARSSCPKYRPDGVRCTPDPETDRLTHVTRGEGGEEEQEGV